MEFAGVLHRRKYRPKLKRFTSDSFKKLNGAISVVEIDCIEETGAGICEHIQRYYASVAQGEPFAFRVIRDCDLDEHFGCGNYSIVPSPSRTGDDCHRNLEGIEDKAAKRFQKNYCDEGDVFWCIDGETHQLDDELAGRLQEILSTLL